MYASRRAATFVLPLLSALALLVHPAAARACGGVFCDNLPDPMPVDQRGEDILFVLDGSTVEVHIRIEYTGEAERFAWVLPLQAIPEVSVGSEPLFVAMSQTTAPVWSTYTTYDCPDDDPWGGSSDGGGFAPLFDLGDGGGPDVVFNEVVGAFEVLVLQGGTAQEVIDFLDANNYAQNPAAEPILQEYLDQGFLFAAVKLAAGAQVEEIHPLSFKFQGTEPCVPIKLTRIAAEDDMGIRAYFLADSRWAPSNYAHVVLNPLAYNWQFTGPDRYLDLLGAAIDEAGGRGFVTDYSASSSAVDQSYMFSLAWDETAFLGVDPITAIDIIDQQGLNTHPLIQSILLQYIPPPDGIPATQFWNNIADYADMIDLNAWDDVAFAAAIAERIIDPGFHATELLDLWPRLTRLSTVMSPGEMTVDPLFHQNPDLPQVGSAAITTQEQVLCGGDRLYHVDVDGTLTDVCVPASAAYPGWVDMPAALRIEQIPMVGPPQVVTDNSAAIGYSYGLYSNGVQCDTAGGGTGTDTGTTGDPTTTTTTTTSSMDAGDESTGGPTYDLPYDVSCGCSTEGGSAPVGIALGLLVLGLIGPWRRRK